MRHATLVGELGWCWGSVRGVTPSCSSPPPRATLRSVAQITDVYVLKRPWVDHFLVRPGAGPDVAVPGEHRES